MIFKFLGKKENKDIKLKINLYEKTAALLIHVAKVDQDYTDHEKEIIEKVMLKLGVKKDEVKVLMVAAEKSENNSVQILDYTKEIKQESVEYKSKVVEALWEIIYSNNEEDMYEASLMRRLCGLLYLDNKTVGDIKERIKKLNIK